MISPEDQDEQERLALQHQAFLITLGHELFAAPVDSKVRLPNHGTLFMFLTFLARRSEKSWIWGQAQVHGQLILPMPIPMPMSLVQT